MSTAPLPYDPVLDAPRAGFTPRAWDSGPPVEVARLGVWVFLASEALFFGGLLAAYLVLRGAARDWDEPLDVRLGLALTALLAGSSIAASRATRALRRGARRAGGASLLVAAGLAALFLAAQALEWRHLLDAGFTQRTSIAGSCFYVLTGAHGLHVLVGVLWLAVAAFGARRAGARTLPAELAALYQHFVDGVWLVLFTVLYLA